jgi:arginase
MKPIFIFAPYLMGDFSPARAALARHTWRLIAAVPADGTPTERMGTLCRMLADEVHAVRNEGHLPVVICGDCTFSIGTLAGLQRKTTDLNLVWFDAHGDFNTHETTPSGFIGGMPLAMLCGRGEQTIVDGAGAKVHPEANVVLTDARNLDPGEQEAVTGSKVTHLANVADLTSLDLADRPIYIHFDSDVLRLADLSAVNYPAEGGPTLDTIDGALTYLAGTGRVAAISVTMWNPELDVK